MPGRDVIIKLDRTGVGQLLKGAEIQADLASRAARIAEAATANAAAAGFPDAEFQHDVQQGHNRAHAGVVTANIDARLAEAIGRSLTRAVDAGRG